MFVTLRDTMRVVIVLVCLLSVCRSAVGQIKATENISGEDTEVTTAANVVIGGENHQQVEKDLKKKPFLVQVGQIVPRHLCRRAIRNLQELVSVVAKRMFDVTDGIESLEEVHIELPASWRGTECSTHLNTTDGRGTNPALVVTGSHPIFGSHPRAVQFGGCGVQGLNVQLPFGVLTESPKMNESLVEDTLKEVMKWRFGVFEEEGHSRDTMYPVNYTDGLHQLPNVGCTKEQAQANHGLCPIPGYNSAAATKQNLLCGGASARQVIRDRPAASAVNNNNFIPPRVRFVIPETAERVILVLEQSPAMEMRRRWSSVLSSTFQYISSLKEGTELAIITFGESAVVHLQPTIVQGGNREGLHYRIPRRLSRGEGAGGEACLACGIGKAAELATTTSTIVLVTSSVSRPDKNLTTLLDSDQLANTIIRRVSFGSSATTTQRRESQDSHAHPVVVVGEAEGSLEATVQLNLAMAGASPQHPSAKFHQVALGSRKLQGSFNVEASLSSDLWVQLLVEDTTDIQVFQLQSPSGQMFSFPKFDAGLIYFSLRGPRETGVWTYKVVLYSEPTPATQLILECWASMSTSTPLTLDSWTSPGTSSSHPMIIYARLLQGLVPVNGAEVVATIQRPGSSTSIKISLTDNGSGYPDITRSDGIYSAYFTQYTGEPGIYSLTVKATNTVNSAIVNTKKLDNSSCCGSSFPSIPSIPLDSFSRYAATPSFYVSSGTEFYIRSGLVQRRDVFPPNRVSDFRLANYFNNSLYVTLAWTAPGDDYTRGQAFKYEIRCFTAREALHQDNFGEQGIQVHSSLVPSPEESGREQRCTVGVPWPNEVFYYAIMAIDSAGNRGQVSNVISVYVKEIPTTSTETPLSSSPINVYGSAPLRSFIHNDSLMYIVAGIISGILIVIILILVIIVRRLGFCHSKPEPSSSSSDVSADTQLEDGLPDLCQDKTRPWTTSDSYYRGSPAPDLDDDWLPHLSQHHLHPLPSAQQLPGIHKISASDHSQFLQFDASSSILHSSQMACPQNPSSSHHPSSSLHHSSSPTDSAGTHSTDCSVSVSECDHESVHVSSGPNNGLQVVTVSPVADTRLSVMEDMSVYKDLPRIHQRPSPQPRKIPPQVPRRTVHASLV